MPAVSEDGPSDQHMNGAFEGDLIRPLGLVTLYCGYAEGELDELLRVLSATGAWGARNRKAQTGRMTSDSWITLHLL